MGAAMDPDHHWQLSRPRRAPDVQLEAILRLMLGYPARDKCGAHRLRTSRAEFCGIADAPPARRCLRRPPAKSADRCGGERNIKKALDVPRSRSEERRVGKEGVSPCRSRWAPFT